MQAFVHFDMLAIPTRNEQRQHSHSKQIRFEKRWMRIAIVAMSGQTESIGRFAFQNTQHFYEKKRKIKKKKMLKMNFLFGYFRSRSQDKCRIYQNNLFAVHSYSTGIVWIFRREENVSISNNIFVWTNISISLSCVSLNGSFVCHN